MQNDTQLLELISDIGHKRGLLWENIQEFNEWMQSLEGAIGYGTEEMESSFPVKHYLKDGLYTREIFMPKGALVVSFIHKQNHPSFFLSGEKSVLMDTGEIVRMKAPMSVQTKIGTQRVAYMHEDCRWACVYKTDAKTIEEAEKEIYTYDYRELPPHVITKKIEELWQE